MSGIQIFMYGFISCELLIIIIKIILMRFADIKTMKQLDSIQKYQKVEHEINQQLLNYYILVNKRLDTIEKPIDTTDNKEEENNDGEIS